MQCLFDQARSETCMLVIFRNNLAVYRAYIHWSVGRIQDFARHNFSSSAGDNANMQRLVVVEGSTYLLKISGASWFWSWLGPLSGKNDR